MTTLDAKIAETFKGIAIESPADSVLTCIVESEHATVAGLFLLAASAPDGDRCFKRYMVNADAEQTVKHRMHLVQRAMCLGSMDQYARMTPAERLAYRTKTISEEFGRPAMTTSDIAAHWEAKGVTYATDRVNEAARLFPEFDPVNVNHLLVDADEYRRMLALERAGIRHDASVAEGEPPVVRVFRLPEAAAT